MDKSVKIWTVEKGEPTEIEMDGKIYDIHPKGAGVVKVKPKFNLVSEIKLKRRQRNRKEIDTLLKQGLQRCTRCWEVKPLINFSKDKHTCTGYYTRCKQCEHKGNLKLKRRHYKQRKMPDMFGRSKKYGTWIKNDEVQKVKNVIGKYALDFKPTTKIISEETHMKIGRIRATLDVMLEKNMIVIMKDGWTPFYKLPYVTSEQSL